MVKTLLVDDDELCHKTVGSLLRDDCGHELLSALNGHQGLELLAEHPDVRIIFCDYKMQGMNGFQFAKKAKELYPKITIIGIGDFPEAESGQPLTEFRRKPVPYTTMDELIKKYCP